MNCMTCGGDNRGGAHFCRHCGIRLSPVGPGDLSPGDMGAVPAAEAGGPSEPAQPAPDAEEGTDASAVGQPETVPEQGPEPAAETEGMADTQAPPAAEGTPALPSQATEGEATPPSAEVPPQPSSAPAPPDDRADADDEGVAPGAPDLPAPADEERPMEPLVPLPAGTVLAERYLLIEAQEVQADEILYLARDLRRCWQCRFEGNTLDDLFCAQCGAALDRPAVRLRQVRDDAAAGLRAEPPPDAVAGLQTEPPAVRLTAEGRHFLVLDEAPPQPQPSPATRAVRLIVGHGSDVGRVRELNEDSVLVLTLSPTFESRTGPVLGLFAVADGMGGHEGGEIASRLALQVLARQVVDTLVLPQLQGGAVADDANLARLGQAAVAANDALYLARQKRQNDMGTTLTAALVRDDRLFLAHVGDSRAYRWNAQGLVQLTTDHSMVASLVAAGRAAPEEIYTHPHRSVIYRCLGDRPVVEVDTAVIPLVGGDRLILCSDGLWEMLRDEGIEDVVLQETHPQLACDRLLKHANAAGGEDNISAIVVQVELV